MFTNINHENNTKKNQKRKLSNIRKKTTKTSVRNY